jgi:2-polyprenyl-3-methyl-5-hydroxy-6-metoxy-1,4-benzoquinol methylase
MKEYLDLNKKMWNDRVEPHLKSSLYDMERFMAGQTSLNQIELKILGNISGREILHLQCHFCQDSLSMARMGAKVTGVDFSENAIETAQKLNEELGLDSRFICSDVQEFKASEKDSYDIVFTSYGTITWLPELDKWASVVAENLKPGGKFIMVEFHPVVWMFDDDFKKVFYSYFNIQPIIEEVQGSYADKNSKVKHTFVGWNHAFAEVLSPLIKQGLILKHFGEYDFTPYDVFNTTVKSDKGYMIGGMEKKLPMTYSLVMEKPL